MRPGALQSDPVVRDPRFRPLAEAWGRLLENFLPLRESRDPFYRYNRALAPGDPPQGWKLHVSATLLSAGTVFAAVAPILAQSGVRFKALDSLVTLKRLNCGSYFGYRQVGKLVAVFARSDAEAVALADALHDATTGLTGPAVPSDLPCRSGGIVFYRYGAFRPLRDGSERCDAIRTPDGDLVPDAREPGRAVPNWVTSPFPAVRDDPSRSRAVSGFLPYQTLSLRGKGSVHRALDTRRSPARLCVLKEGVRRGEIDLDRRDGYSRLEDELSALTRLRALGLPVPRVLADFAAGDRRYVAMEHIDGESLQTLLAASDATADLDASLAVCLQTARWMDRLHASGWAWRDCKPQNLILTGDGLVRAIDFEEATSTDAPDALPAGTRAYLPPEWPAGHPVTQDLYALGVTFHQTLSASIRPSVATALGAVRADLPPAISALVSTLLSDDPLVRPPAGRVVDILQDLCDRRHVDIRRARLLLEQVVAST